MIKNMLVILACLGAMSVAACNQTTTNTGRDPGDPGSSAGSGGGDRPGADNNGSRALMKRP